MLRYVSFLVFLWILPALAISAPNSICREAWALLDLDSRTGILNGAFSELLADPSKISEVLPVENARHEFARLIIKRSGVAELLRVFPDLKLRSPHYREMAAQAAVEKAPAMALSNISAFHLNGTQRYRIALSVTERYRSQKYLLDAMTELELTEAQRFEVACAWRGEERFPYNRLSEFKLGLSYRRRFLDGVPAIDLPSVIDFFDLPASERAARLQAAASRLHATTPARKEPASEELIAEINAIAEPSRRLAAALEYLNKNPERGSSLQARLNIPDAAKVAWLKNYFTPDRSVWLYGSPDQVFHFENPNDTFDVLKHYLSAKLHIASDVQPFLSFLRTADVSQSQRRELILLAAIKGYIGVQEGPKFVGQLANEDLRLEVLQAILKSKKNDPIMPKVAARKELALWLALVPSHQKELLYSLAEAGAPVPPELLTAAGRWSLAQNLANVNPKILLENLHRYELSRSQRFQLALFIAKGENPETISNSALVRDFLTRFDLTQAQRCEVAKIIYNEEPRAETVNSIIRDLDLSQDSRREIAISRMRKFPKEDPKGIVRLLGLSVQDKERLTRVPFATDPLTHLENTAQTVSGQEGREFVDRTRVLLKEYSAKHADILPAAWIEPLFDRVQDVDTGLKLLSSLYRHTGYDIRRPVPDSSLEILRAATGISCKPQDLEGVSSNRLGLFYNLVLDIQHEYAVPAFQGVKIDPLLYNKNLSDLNEYLVRLRDLFFLRGGTAPHWTEMLREFHLKDHPLTAQNIKERSQVLEQAIESTVQSMFSGTDISISYDQLRALQDRWGNLSPIYTLLARYRGGNEGWQKEIPELARIFRAILGDHFEKLKFEGEPNNAKDQELAKRQLAVLKTPERQKAWRKIRNRIAVFDPAGARLQTTEEKLQDVQRIFHDNLIRHIGNLAEVPAALRPQIFQQFIQGLDLSVIRSNLFPELSKSDAHRQILSALIPRLGETRDIQESRQLALRLMALKQELSLSTQVKDDLRAISDALLEQTGTGQRSIVFTTSFNDARTMLTIGDLVKTSSCQNYRTGSHIETLPGYVLDAHTQGIASFSIEAQHFKSGRDFADISTAIQEGRPVNPKYNGDQMTVTFEFERAGQKVFVTTKSLEYAFIRRLLRVGTTRSGSAGVQMEPAYLQSHLARNIMNRQIEEIFQQTAIETGSVTNEPIKVEASRNDGGTYTDRGGGAQRDAFTIGGD